MWADKEQRANCVTYNITQKLSRLSSLRSEHCIFKVYDCLKKVNEEAYEPKTICIGPYHHHKRYPNTSLELMEEHKLSYLDNFVKKTNVSVLTCVKAMQDLEESTRNCYAEPINDLNSNEFVEMMLLDSCFIVEFLGKYDMRFKIDKHDYIFRMTNIRMGIIKDLLLLENQIPFIVLDKVFKMRKINLEESISMAIRAFKHVLPSIDLSSAPIHEIQSVAIKHLLGLMHHCWCFPFKKMLAELQDANIDGTIDHNRHMDSTVKLLIDRVPTLVSETSSSSRPDGDGGYCLKLDSPIKAATELQEFGIKFKRSDSKKLFDLNFENGTIQMPPLLVKDGTESVLRNLIAYEQCLPNMGRRPNYFTDYALFMDQLVNSSKDVETLSHGGIILNALGEDEVVSKVLNKLCLEIFISPKFLYSDIYVQLNKHCEQKHNRQMANLRRNYCNSPWAFISVLGAVVLLLLTVMQTIFSALSVTQGD